MTMKKSLFFFSGFVCAVVAVFAFRALRVHFSKPSFTPQPITFQFKPPVTFQALNVLQVKDDVTKIPLEATEAAQLKQGDQILVGEPITTGLTGQTTLQLDSALTTTISTNT